MPGSPRSSTTFVGEVDELVGDRGVHEAASRAWSGRGYRVAVPRHGRPAVRPAHAPAPLDAELRAAVGRVLDGGALHPRARGRGLRGGVRGVARRAPRRRRRQRHRGADDRPARARGRAGRRGRRAVVHVLRERRGDPAARAPGPSSATSTPRPSVSRPRRSRAALTPRTKAVDRRPPLRQRRAGARDRGARRARCVEDAAQAAGSPGPDGAARRARHRRDVLLLPVEEPRRLRRRRRDHDERRRRSPTASGRCASTARATRSPTSRSATTRASTSCRRRSCASSSRTSTTGPTHRARCGRWYDGAGLGELVALPASRRRAPRPRGTSTSSRHARADELAGGRCRPRGRGARRTTACRSTASPRWPPSCGTATELPGHRGGRRATHLRCRSAPCSPREQVDEVVARACARCASGSTSPTARTSSCCARSSSGCARRGHEVRGHGARLRADARAVRALRASSTTAIGHHRGGRLAAKARRPRVALARRSARWARGRRASTSRSATAPTTSPSPRGCCGIPCVDDVRLRVGDGPAHGQLPPGPARSSCPTRSRPSAWPATARAASSARYPGLKEEYYLADFEPDAGGARRARPRPRARRSPSCARRRRSRSTTASRTTSSRSVLDAPARAAPGRRAAAHAPSSAPSSRARAASSSPSTRSTRSR